MNGEISSYYAPTDIPEALKIKKSLDGQIVRFLAGGTDLKLTNCLEPTAVIDLKKIKSLRGIELNTDKLKLGSLVSIHELYTSGLIKERFGLLWQAARELGSRQIRMRGTMGGNICNASPAADLATALLALDATLHWHTEEGPISETMEDFYNKEPRSTELYSGCILDRVEINIAKADAKAVYLKLGERKAMDLALVSVAIAVDKNNAFTISLGSVAPSPIRARQAEEFLNKSGFTKADIDQAAGLAATASRPISDMYASAEYRKEMVRVLVRRGLASMKRAVYR